MAANGTVVQRYAYDAYGNPIAASGLATSLSALTNFLYSGEQTDKYLGMQYLRARYLQPASGRFSGFDSDDRSMHKYAYASDNPVNYADPSGNLEFSLGGFLSATAISAIGYNALRAAGYSHEEATQAIEEADVYFNNIGVDENIPTRIPGNRQ